MSFAYSDFMAYARRSGGNMTQNPVIPLACILFTLFTTSLFATTRFVSPSGNDTGSCTNSASPCQTFTYAISQAASGDTISAANGTYKENLFITKNLTLKGSSISSTILDGNSLSSVVDIAP